MTPPSTYTPVHIPSTPSSFSLFFLLLSFSLFLLHSGKKKEGSRTSTRTTFYPTKQLALSMLSLLSLSLFSETIWQLVIFDHNIHQQKPSTTPNELQLPPKSCCISIRALLDLSKNPIFHPVNGIMPECFCFLISSQERRAYSMIESYIHSYFVSPPVTVGGGKTVWWNGFGWRATN